MIEVVNYSKRGLEALLGGRDSNPDKHSQSLRPSSFILFN